MTRRAAAILVLMLSLPAAALLVATIRLPSDGAAKVLRSGLATSKGGKEQTLPLPDKVVVPSEASSRKMRGRGRAATAPCAPSSCRRRAGAWTRWRSAPPRASAASRPDSTRPSTSATTSTTATQARRAPRRRGRGRAATGQCAPSRSRRRAAAWTRWRSAPPHASAVSRSGSTPTATSATTSTTAIPGPSAARTTTTTTPAALHPSPPPHRCSCLLLVSLILLFIQSP
ncbi:unnamed protein product [Triticum turgidum subsp. durum]|uniref:Uncharacterized protein n=1 Tax=Triticum turgidum subsp. durum TaxID=4567 RepID=A0A9R1RW64_TRITD|nr:unnamed protein product [Triticum turgidum subsp. durum]